VELTVDNVYCCVSTASPFRFNWNTNSPLTPGSHNLTLVAYDASWHDAIVNVPVTTTHNVTLTVISPTDNQTISGPSLVTTHVSSSVTRVEFTVDGAYQATVTTAPFEWMMPSWSPGTTHTITVVAYNSDYSMMEISTVHVNVSP
jgi:hypothetical protein